MLLELKEKYENNFTIKETEIAIKKIKDFFERSLAMHLNLIRVSAPLYIYSGKGQNDNLSGVERAIKFDVPDLNKDVEIVHSLAKWKRIALSKYGFEKGEGLYADMSAIRRDEERLDNTHSIYVDQWDWEIIIDKNERTEEFLKEQVRKIYQAFKETEDYVYNLYKIEKKLPEDITFLTTKELYEMYKDESEPDKREDLAAKKYGAIFVMKIGDIIDGCGKSHGKRSPDYDDWTLNGDIIFNYPLLDMGLELSSMGIRVDKKAMLEQLEKSNCMDRLKYDYHKAIIDEKLPYTIGGGIGQSRICMFFLNKAHIGEVQSSVWSEEDIENGEKLGIKFL